MKQEDNLIWQSLITTVLLINLSLPQNDFLNSDYYKNMIFDFPELKEHLKHVKIDNQGCAIMILYALLVVPKETLKIDYRDINNEIRSFVLNENSTYSSDMNGIEYIRHMRNAIAHCKIEFEPSVSITFLDENQSKETCFFTLPLNKIGEVISDLIKITNEYYHPTLK